MKIGDKYEPKYGLNDGCLRLPFNNVSAYSKFDCYFCGDECTGITLTDGGCIPTCGCEECEMLLGQTFNLCKP